MLPVCTRSPLAAWMSAFGGQNFRYRPGDSLKLALPSVPVSLACAFSIAEILYAFLCLRLRSRLAEGYPPVRPELQLLTPQQYLGSPLGVYVSPSRTLVGKDYLV